MKTVFVLVFNLLMIYPLFSQTKDLPYQVFGQVIEKKTAKEIPYTTITLVNDSTKEKKAMASDGSGKFTLKVSKAANYTLIVSSIGYKEIRKPVKVTETKTDLGKIQMDEGVELKEVTISAQKPLVRVDVDKIVYSMESDPDSKTNNALEMLRKVPLITVDAEENITLNGQSNYKVLINGKSSSMMSNNLKEVLKSMPANTIKDIEVITNPSSKYDAEGVGGIINIITAKKTVNGYNGSLSAGVDARGGFNGSAYLGTKIKKLSFSARVFGNQFIQPESESTSNGEYYNVPTYHFTNSNSSSKYKGSAYSFSGEGSFDIDSLNLISMSFWGYNGTYNMNGTSGSYYSTEQNVISRSYQNTMNMKSSYGSVSGNIDYQKTYKKPDKSLTFSYKLDNNPRTSDNFTDVNGIISYPNYKQESSNDADGREQTLQVDYYDPLTKMHQIEGGLKMILRQNTSYSEFYRNDSIQPDRKNDLDYDQYIMGAYAGYVFKWKKLSTKTGLRMERTWNDGTSTSKIVTSFTNRLFNIVPYITMSLMPKAGRTFKVSYTQRLSRPGIWYLNPYRNEVDSLNVSYGNPDLKSEISHSFEFAYTIYTPKFNLNASSYASFVNNSIERISTIKNNGGTESTYQNIGKNQSYGLNLYSSYRPNAKFNLYFNGGMNYSQISAVNTMNSSNQYAISNKGFNYRGTLGVRWTTWKDGSINLYGGLYSPNIMLQGKSSTFYYTSFSVSQYMMKRKLMFSISTTDPFWYKKTYSYDRSDPTFYSHSESNQLAQNVRFNISYNFGKMDFSVKKAKRGISNDDVKSGGDSQSSEK